MNLKLLMLVFLLNCLNILGQNTKKVNYAEVEIEVPNNYYVDSESALISNDSFSAQWLYLSEEMYNQNVQGQIIKQFEEQLEGKAFSEINFISSGGKLNGKIYKMRGHSKFKFKIIATGIVNNQPLILNLSFKIEPKSNESFDELILNFIKL